MLVPGRGEMFVREAPGPVGAPTVVLLHGWTVSADLNWFAQYALVSERARVIAVDHRGHGRGIRSEEPFSLEAAADDVAALLEALDVGPAILVGFSMGGPISMLTWQRHPDAVRGLVLAATALEWRATRRERFMWRAAGILELLFRLGNPNGLVERYLREAIEKAPEMEPLRPWFKAELRRGDPSDLARAGQALGAFDAREFAGAIDVPAAVIHTTRDRLVRSKKQRELAAAIPGARRIPVEADHDATMLAVVAFNAALAEALDAVGAPATSSSNPVGNGSSAPATADVDHPSEAAIQRGAV